jgi:nitroreductase
LIGHPQNLHRFRKYDNAAALTGIDSCPIEGFHRSRSLIESKIGVDTDKYGLSYMIAFGYRKADPANPKQEEISKILGCNSAKY